MAQKILGHNALNSLVGGKRVKDGHHVAGRRAHRSHKPLVPVHAPANPFLLQKLYGEAGRKNAEIMLRRGAATAQESKSAPSKKEQLRNPQYKEGRVSKEEESRGYIYPQERFSLAREFHSEYSRLSAHERTRILESNSLPVDISQLLAQKLHSGKITEEHDRSSIPLSVWHKIRQAVKDMEKLQH